MAAVQIHYNCVKCRAPVSIEDMERVFGRKFARTLIFSKVECQSCVRKTNPEATGPALLDLQVP